MSILERIEGMRKNNRFRRGWEGPFDIEISGEGATSRHMRGMDKEAVAAYNKELTSFWSDVASQLQSSADLMIRKNKLLSNSIRPNTYKEYGEIYKLGFSFRKEGVYVHKGVGRGYVMAGGAVVKTSKSPGFNRHPVLWFNPVIEKNMPKLRDIVLKYNKELVINTARIFIK